MDITNYFARDYRAARAKFLEAADAAGARVESFENPAVGPDGATLFTDVARFGDDAADRVMVANSATHGVEGFCGSGALVGWLRSAAHRRLPANVRAVLIHAINPHGFAWLRRVTEDNVDLNRNFVDHGAPYPENADYDPLHPVLVPDSWDDASLAAAATMLAEHAERHGALAMQAAVSRGQYAHPDGMFYGGRAATWSNRTFRTILAQVAAGAAHVAFLDFHTGLGPYGTADLISAGVPGTPYGDRLKAWYGEGLSSPTLGNSTSVPLFGFIANAVRQGCPDAVVTSITLEFGTYPLERVLLAIRADNWLHARGVVGSDLGRGIKAEIRQAFYPDEDDWKELVYLRSRQIMRRAVAGLAAA